MFTTLGAFLRHAEHTLSRQPLYYGHGTNNPWDEACAIASFVLGLPPDAKSSIQKRALTEEENHKLMQLLNRRIKERIPLPYLSHTAWFSGLPFFVNEDVIIPRSPLAELIEHQFSPWISTDPKRILDLCTGSGCIAVALAKAFPHAQVDAVDIDKKALRIAKMNVIRHAVEKQVTLIHSDLFSGVKELKYDLIISNPPYVPTDEFANLPKEYEHEPALALEAGPKGLKIVDRILQKSADYLTKSGILIVEVGSAADNVMHAHPNLPFTWLTFERGGEGVFLLTQEALSVCKVF